MGKNHYRLLCLVLLVIGLFVFPKAAGLTETANPRDVAGYQPEVPMRDFSRPRLTDDEASLTPDSLVITLAPGQSTTEDKLLHLPESPAPTLADIIFCIDLTGSMDGELANVKLNSVDIMDSLTDLIPDCYFGVISHMDYNGYYEYCGYGNYYGYADSPCFDYPYSLDQALTGTPANVQTAINGLALGCGDDGPEDYTRALYECYADAGVGWRPGSARFVVQWGDDIPHDCDVFACIGSPGTTTGTDPGRDAAAGTADDLAVVPTLNGMAANNITLIALHSGGYFDLWDCYAGITGGDAFLINYDGTVPGGIDIAEYIASAISQQFVHIDTLTLEVCTSGYEGWLVSVSPAYYADIDLTSAQDFNFQITIQVPADTETGVYCFEICAVGDGATYASQDVCVTVPAHSIDIKPQSCPNPLNTKSKGVLPVAILGTDIFDVTEVDPGTVTLEGVSPIRWAYEDVTTPMDPLADVCECNEEGPDGFMDMTFKFATQDIVAALGDVTDGEVRILTFEGLTFDGDPVWGQDCVWIKDRGGDPLPPPMISVRTFTGGMTNISLSLSRASDVTAVVYDVRGKRIRTLVNSTLSSGDHEIVWDGRDANHNSVAHGVYFCKVKVDGVEKTAKMVLMQ
jgi:hypothetical protein